MPGGRTHTRVEIVGIVEMEEILESVWMIYLRGGPPPEWK